MPHILLYFIALLSLSTSSSWSKLNQMPAEVLGFWRLAIAGVLVSLWVFGIKKTKLPKLEKNLFWVILAGVFFFAHLWTYKYAAKNTSIANTMILFASNPVWATLGAITFFNEKLTFRLLSAYLLAALGVVILFYNRTSFQSDHFQGDMSALFSALFYAIFMLAGKKARQYYTNYVFASFQYLVCASLFFLATLGTHHNFIGYSDVSWLAVAGLVILPTFLGHFLFTHLVNYMDLSFMTCGKLIEPIIAVVIAYFLFNETLSLEACIAFILTSLSLLILFGPKLIKPKTLT